tara:strand:+ start:296 stop:727 length:432 start_codon:yes stop_codon:yes gene_type:complete
MSVSVKEVQRALAIKIGDLSGFREVRQLPELFGRTQNTLAHLGFSVEVSNSQQASERQRIAVGLYVDTTVRVKLAYRLRPHDLVLDYGNALDKEQEVIQAVMQRNFAKGIEVRFLRASRRTPDSQEYLISEIELQALHTIELT